MAAAWRKVKAEKDVEFTLRDMLAIYQGQSTYAKYDNTPAVNGINLSKILCADKNNAAFQQKLKVAVYSLAESETFNCF